MRKGREFYSPNYGKAIELHKKGLSVNEIARQLKISYSCAYHWVKGLRRPDTGKLIEFENFLKNGPKPVIEVKDKFPKHNELFLVASRRGIPIKRYSLKRKFGDYSKWYFLSGQEEELKEDIKELLKKYEELRGRLIEAIR